MANQIPIKGYAIGSINISSVNMPTTINAIEQKIEKNESAYICVTNVRTSMLSQKDLNYCAIQNNSFLTVPDGKPIIWYARLLGIRNCERVSGVDLLQEILSISAKRGYSHYFYGSTQKIIDKMKTRILKDYPGILLTGLYSPPFRPLTDSEIDNFIEQINMLRPTFLWVGLGAPKQEQFMERVFEHLDGVILVGVGLAFDYIAGTVSRAPVWMQHHGLEWLYRSVQQPLKVRRFFIPFFKFAWILTVLGARRLTGQFRNTEIEE